MDTWLIDHDTEKATSFLSGMTEYDVAKLLDKYDGDIDGELRADECKMAIYLHLREQGVEHVWAAGRACRRFGRMINSDGAFHEHARQRMEGMPKWLKDSYMEQARKAGINTHGRYYMSGLGAPDDDKAWVHEPSDVVTVAKERHLNVSGAVNYQAAPADPKYIPLADDLVDEAVQGEMQRDPALAERCRKSQAELNRLRGLVREKYGTPKSKWERKHATRPRGQKKRLLL